MEGVRKNGGMNDVILVLLSQDLPSPFVIVRFARMLVPKRNSVYMVHD